MRRKRILLYSHDTYGLGHLRRNLLLAETLCGLPEQPAILVATGSPRTQAFELPDHCDTFKLPAVTKTSDGRYKARSLPVSIEEVTRMRADLIVSAYRAFDPDLILVDHAPTGMRGELLPLFRELLCEKERRGVRLVLGLRDVIDEPERVLEEWQRNDAWRWIDTLYDRVLVYGDQRVGSTALDLNLADRLPGRVHHVGYLGRPSLQRAAGERNRPVDRHAPDSNEELSDAESPELPEILVTVGGGGDGQRVLRAVADYLESLKEHAAFRTIVVTGPFLSRSRFREIRSRLTATGQPVEVLRFTNRMVEYMTRARGIISMAGYNSVTEILAAGVPSLLIPRESPRLEQVIRITRLRGRCDFESASMREIGAEHVGQFVSRILELPRLHSSSDIALDGLRRAALEIHSLLVTEDGGVDVPARAELPSQPTPERQDPSDPSRYSVSRLVSFVGRYWRGREGVSHV